MKPSSDYIKCPRCGHMGLYRNWYKPDLEIFTCWHCGYSKMVKGKSNRKPNGKERFIAQGEEIKGFGAVGICLKGGERCFGILNQPINAKTIRRHRRIFALPAIDPSKSYLAKWDDKKKKVIYLIGNPPEFLTDEDLG